MDAKRIILILMIIVQSTLVFSQIQEGYVMTIGRPDRPSAAVPHATIRVQGVPNAVVSNDNGYFKMIVPGKKDGDELVILNVQKNGYELRDREMKDRKKVFSSHVPIYILMVDIKQLESDIRRIEKKAYKTAEVNYCKKVSDLEVQLEGKKISADYYRQELNNLQQQYEKYLSMIGDMADRYARTDYNQLDSIDCRIYFCIENGEFETADSLIHTVFNPETVLERNKAAKEEIRQRIAFAQQVIDKAKADKEALLRDRDYASRVVILCINLADEHLLNNQPIDAIHCLEQALDIQQILFGIDSPEVGIIQQKINTLNQ